MRPTTPRPARHDDARARLVRVRRYASALAIVGIAASCERVLAFALGDGWPDGVTMPAILAWIAWREGRGPAIAAWIAATIVVAASALLFPLHVALVSTLAFAATSAAVAAIVLRARASWMREHEAADAARRDEVATRDALLEREDVEDRMQAHRDWYSVTLKSIADAVITIDPRGDVQFVNATAERLTGVSAEDAMQRPLDRLFRAFDERSGADVGRDVREALARGESRSAIEPVVLRSHDGVARVVSYSSAPIHFHDGRLLGGVVVFRDVSRERSAEIEQRRLLTAAREAEGAAQTAQRELEGAHRMFAAFMANLPHPAFIQDASGRFVFVNEAGRRTTGWDEAAAMPAGDDPESQYSTSNDRHYFRIRFPVQLGGERMLGGIALDVTERVRTERKLAERTAELETLFRNVPAPLWIARDANAVQVEGNPAAKALLDGLDQRGPGGESAWRFLHAGRPVPADALPMRVAMRERRVVESTELELVRPDGTHRHLLSTAAPLFDSDGRVRGGVAAALDISELKAYEAALRRADRRKDEFLATLAHELRNPLAPIRNAVAILRRAPDDPARVTRASGVIHRQVGMMVRLIDDLLDIARISQGLVELKPERRAVAEVVDAAVEIAMPSIAARGQRLEIVHDDPGIATRVDPVRTEQVLVNLLSNAAKYSPQGSRILVRTARAGDFCEVAVVDEGEGIEPGMLPPLFDMFTRRLDPGGHRPPGLGVGLALARRLAIQQGGRLEGRSAGAGRGSTFTVSLPLDGPHADGAAPASPAIGDAGGPMLSSTHPSDRIHS